MRNTRWHPTVNSESPYGRNCFVLIYRCMRAPEVQEITHAFLHFVVPNSAFLQRCRCRGVGRGMPRVPCGRCDKYRMQLAVLEIAITPRHKIFRFNVVYRRNRGLEVVKKAIRAWFGV